MEVMRADEEGMLVKALCKKLMKLETCGMNPFEKNPEEIIRAMGR
jgi:hypothetical protein